MTHLVHLYHSTYLLKLSAWQYIYNDIICYKSLGHMFFKHRFKTTVYNSVDRNERFETFENCLNLAINSNSLQNRKHVRSMLKTSRKKLKLHAHIKTYRKKAKCIQTLLSMISNIIAISSLLELKEMFLNLI